MADPVQENLLREIQEDLRRERLEKLWKRYGSVLIGAALAIVVAVAAYQAWKAWELSQLSKVLDAAVNRLGVRVPRAWAHEVLGIPQAAGSEAVLEGAPSDRSVTQEQAIGREGV